MAWNKKKNKEAEEEFFNPEPTRSEAEELRLKLTKYEQTRINGRLQTKFEQYCKVNGVLYFDENGVVVITNPTEYTRLRKMNEKLESMQSHEQEAYLKTHPEEQEKLLSLRKTMQEEMNKKFSILL